jgi:hypothetical protein
MLRTLLIATTIMMVGDWFITGFIVLWVGLCLCAARYCLEKGLW